MNKMRHLLIIFQSLMNPNQWCETCVTNLSRGEQRWKKFDTMTLFLKQDLRCLNFQKHILYIKRIKNICKLYSFSKYECAAMYSKMSTVFFAEDNSDLSSSYFHPLLATFFVAFLMNISNLA